eukprot:TRINITY_DN20807_c0_g1_i1.p1 TRINITY_DN20807_c0_g1~~TRINITY_DN20807_c0_g1_i1.p1  ORF type:complete len:261 (-),score=40.61 TRINITY_DN20807_c0_g1_i1:29-775(-)
MVKAQLRKRPEASATGKEIYESIIKKMRTGAVHDAPSSLAVLPAENRSKVAKARQVERGAKTSGKQTARYPAKRCPLAWLGCAGKSIRDTREHFMQEHNLKCGRHLPKNKRFCTTSTLTTEAKEWGHLTTLQGGTQIISLVGFHPDISRSHCFISVFSLGGTGSASLGPISATITSPEDDAEGQAHMTSAKFTWHQVPHMKDDLEQLMGLFPVKMFRPRLAEGMPHERVIEVTVELDNTATQGSITQS